tara:strand:+ start:1673 stop:2353 length:681 start_codon:yes stop_codon:yes gene_type:complete
MIIQTVEKQKTYLNSLHKYILVLFLFVFTFTYGQREKDSIRKLKKIGILYNSAKQNNALFFDKDYNYKTDVIKVQFFYNLKDWEQWDFNLILQPQVQIANHQLLNLFFVGPEEDNYQELRDKFTQKKTISLYAFELGFQLRRKIFKNISFEVTLGLGASYIDVETERLAQGFTFIENFSLGLAYSFNKSELYIGSNLGHVSNFNIQLPNSGYNILGFEIGYRIYLK